MDALELWDYLDQTIYDIYRAEELRTLRTGFLEHIRNIIPYQAAFFDLKSAYRTKDVYHSPVAVGISDDALQNYYEKYAGMDYASWVLNQPEAYYVYRDSDIIQESAIRQSVLYKEWLDPLGLAYGCGAIAGYDGIVYGTVTFARMKENGDFTDAELDALKRVMKHISLKFHQMYPAGIPYTLLDEQHIAFQERYRLTNREKQLCGLLYQGLPTHEIAEKLCISVHTVSRHIANIYRKVHVNDRIALMNKMREEHICR